MKGVFSYVFAFITMSMILTLLFFVVIPLSVRTNDEMVKASETILESDHAVEKIQNEEIRDILMNNKFEMLHHQAQQSIILGTFFKYAWLIIIGTITMVIFVKARRDVEVDSFYNGEYR